MKKFLSSKGFIFLLPVSISGIFYFFTASRQLTFANYGGDGGDFLAAILTAGIPHPTGYPTYTLLGIIFQHFPLGDPYFRAGLLSWLPAALGAGLLAIGAQKFLPENISPFQRTIISIISGLVWGLMPFLWSQAVIIEVHGLQSLFLVLTMWWLLFLFKEAPNQKNLFLFILFSFCFGLGIGNHITILLFLPAILFGFFYASKNGNSTRHIIYQIIGILLGSLVYLYLPLRASHYPPINWGNPQTFQGFWWVVSGSPYQKLISNITSIQVITRISALAGLIMEQFGIPGIILGILGAVQYTQKRNPVSLALLYIFLAFSVFSILYGTDDSLAYLLATYLVFVIWIAVGLSILISNKWKKYPVGKILMAGYFVFILVNIPKTIQMINPRGHSEPAKYAQSLLENVPKNAIILTSSDDDSFPLWYYHFGLKIRPDVKVIVLPLTQFQWYQQILMHTYPKLNFPDIISQTANQNQNWGERIPELNPQHPVCKSNIIQTPNRLIIIVCSTGESFQFDISGK